VTELLSSGTTSPCLDIKLLTFSLTSNSQDVEDLVKHELDSCLYVSRFEFLQKLAILKLWQAHLLGSSDLKDAKEAFMSNYFKIQPGTLSSD
jgi:hypothetical protein